jgi:hypothetical protein
VDRAGAEAAARTSAGMRTAPFRGQTASVTKCPFGEAFGSPAGPQNLVHMDKDAAAPRIGRARQIIFSGWGLSGFWFPSLS